MTNQNHLAVAPAAGRQPAMDTQRQLQQIAALVNEYAESAQATNNADMMILLFQLCMVLGDDPAQVGRRIFRTPPP